MNVKTQNFQRPGGLLPSPPIRPDESRPQESPDIVSVSFDSKKKTYHFESATQTESVRLQNVWKAAAKGALFVGGAAALGAAERQLMGSDLSAGSLYMLASSNAGLGAAVGLALGVHSANKQLAQTCPDRGLDGQVVNTGIATAYGVAGGTLGMVVATVLPLAGVFGGWIGAVAAGGLGAAITAWSALAENRAIHKTAVEHGYRPQP